MAPNRQEADKKKDLKKDLKKDVTKVKKHELCDNHLFPVRRNGRSMS